MAWIAGGRLAEITCDVRDGAVMGQLVVGARVLARLVLPIEESELPYMKVFSALASLLRAGRTMLPPLLTASETADAGSYTWFGGWKYLPCGTTISRAACFTLPKLAIRIAADERQVFNWGALPAAQIGRILDDSRAEGARGPAAHQRILDDRCVPSREGYQAAAQEVLDALANGCEKIVLGRKRTLVFSKPVDPLELFGRLLENRGHTFQYLMTLDGEAWVGISPELLLRRTGMEIESRPLAGSRRRGASLTDDAGERQSLLSSDKDSREHEIAVTLMFRRLLRICEAHTLKIASGRNIAELSYIQHLATEIVGRLGPGYDAIDALNCICPPATILGKPEARAEQVLRACEPFQRSYFTGGLGVLSANGDCDLALCIRSAAVNGHELHLYAGSGYVAGSQPEDEWRETEVKMRPFIDAVRDLLQESDAKSSILL